jgi:hypothetical protein
MSQTIRRITVAFIALLTAGAVAVGVAEVSGSSAAPRADHILCC